MDSLYQPPLTVLEEFILLAHDEKSNRFHPLTPCAMCCASAGAVLMDLTLRNRVDNDLKHLFVIDGEPMNDDLLDPVLQTLLLAPVLERRPISIWLRSIADEGEALQEKALRRLEKRGILRREAQKIFWIFTANRYPLLNMGEVTEVRKRLKEVILKDVIPLPHDIVLTALAQACGLFRHILDKNELENARSRIEQVAKMDLIGQAVAQATNEIEMTMTLVSGFH